jgi:hypothetical protein
MSRRRTRPSVYDIVLNLLKKDEVYRNSDRKLRWRIWANMGLASQNSAGTWSITYDAEIDAPPTESIRRSRQKVQELYPELRPTDPVVCKARRIKFETKGTFIYHEEAHPTHYKGARS